MNLLIRNKIGLQRVLGALFLAIAFISVSIFSPVYAQNTEQECIDSGGEWVVIGNDGGIPQYACSNRGEESEPGEGFTPPSSGVDCTSGSDPGCCIGEDGKGVRLGVGVECSENSDNVILAYLVGIINFLAVGVGIVVTGMIIVGGIEYIIAGGVPQKLEKAKSLITNALIALVTFIFMYAILQWLIPGGLF